MLPEIQPRTELSETLSSYGQKPVLVAPAPRTRTKLKTPSSSATAGAIKRAPVKSKRKQIKPRQDNIFKRFTALVVDFFKEKSVWAKKKPDTTDIDHDKRVAENYVFDEVLGRHVSRAEYEKRAHFNSEGYKPTSDEITRFPSRPEQGQTERNHSMDLTPSIPPEQARSSRYQRLRPPGFHNSNE